MKHGNSARISPAIVLLGSILLMHKTCDAPLTISDGFVAAMIRSDGIIETRSSPDGTRWTSPHQHTDVGAVDHGVGLASDTSGALVFLALFAKDNAGRTKLFVRTGLGDNWESNFPNQIPVSTASAPVISRLDDRHFFLAWNSGAGGIATALLDTRRSGRNDSITRLQDINDALASDIEGAPSVAVSGDRIVIVWRRHAPGNAVSFAANHATFRAGGASVEFGTSERLRVTSPQGLIPSGFPQLSISDERFVLAIGLGPRFAYFISSDGREFIPFGCVDSLPVLASSERPHAIALGRDARIVHIVAPLAPDSTTSNERGLVIVNCAQETPWTDDDVFFERGTARFQPAVTFRRGNN